MSGDKENFSDLKRLAESGDVGAQRRLGEIFEKGIGVQQSDELAVDWYTKAILSDDFEAWCCLEEMGLEGFHDGTDDLYSVEAMHERGSGLARYRLGQLLEKRLGFIGRDGDIEAAWWYSGAARKGNPDAVIALERLAEKDSEYGPGEALYRLGQLYEEGVGVNRSYNLAAYWYERAWMQGKDGIYAEESLTAYLNMAKNGLTDALSVLEQEAADGNPDAQYRLACLHDCGNDQEKAVHWYVKAMEQGSANARNALGWMARNGNADVWSTLEQMQKCGNDNAFRVILQVAIDHDCEDAWRFLRKLAEQGNTEAQGVLKRNLPVLQKMAEDGKDEVLSLIKQEAMTNTDALSVLEEIAAAGNALSQNRLGRMYEHGSGVAQSYEKAAEWYALAAAQGDTLSQFRLALMYEHGTGVAQSYEKAVEFYSLAAEQEHADAQFNLGKMYERGEGVEHNIEKAIEFYGLAADMHQHQGALDALRRLRTGESPVNLQ